jgi:hypothetical protein
LAAPVHLPQHLARRILDSRGLLEGERKQITVLFADIKGSSLGAQRWARRCGYRPASREWAADLSLVALTARFKGPSLTQNSPLASLFPRARDVAANQKTHG